MIAWGPDFADYVVMVSCCVWLAWGTRDAIHEVSIMVRRWRRRRRNRITLRITSSNGPGYDRPARHNARRSAAVSSSPSA